IRAGSSVKSRVQAIFRKFETFLNDECCIGVIDEIFLGDSVVRDGVADQSAEKRNVGAGANLDEEVGGGGGAREARVNGNQFGVAVALGLHRRLESTRMVFGGVSTHDQHHVGVLDVDPAVGH